MLLKFLILSVLCCTVINSYAIKLFENGDVDYIIGQDNFDNQKFVNILDNFQSSIESAVNSSKASLQVVSSQKELLKADLLSELKQISRNSDNDISNEIKGEEENLSAAFGGQEKSLLQKYRDFEDQLKTKKQELDFKIEELINRKQNYLETCENNEEYEDLSTCEDIMSLSFDSQINATRLEDAVESKIIEKKMKKLEGEMKQNFLNYQVSLNNLYTKKLLKMEAVKVQNEKAQVVYKNTIKLYEKHVERVEGLLETLQENVSTISKKFFEIKAINLDTETTMTDSSLCSWKRWNDLTTELDDNAVIGGRDVDGTILYVIRSRSDESMAYSYGKFAVARTHAYITDNEKELGVRQFEVIQSIS